jgi:zinc protease
MNCTRTLGRLLLAGLLVCTLSRAAAARAEAAPAKAQKVVSVEGLTEYKLDNGCRYLFIPDPSSATVTINMTVRVGSRHEGYGEMGMAHLLEHMLFKGSKLFPFVDKALQKHGASANATTWLDRTHYFETMPAADANLEFGIRFEADRLVNSFIRREDLAKEMTVVRNEFEMGENSPEQILSQRMVSAAYLWHNYGHSTIGNRADIERVPIDRLQAFYRKFYRPDNVLLIVAGKFDEAKAHDYIARYFGALKRPREPLLATYTQEPPQDGERHVTLRRVGKVSVVGVLYHIPAASHPDYAALDVLDSILGSPPGGRLYKALVETKKATAVHGGSFALHDPGLTEFRAPVSDTSTPEEVRTILLKVLEEFSQKPATAEEVERARRENLAARERTLANTRKLALELTEWEAAGDWRLFFLERDRIARVTPQDIDRVAKAYFVRSNRTTGVFHPTPPQEIVRAVIPEDTNLDAALKKLGAGKGVAAGEKFDPTPPNIEARTKRTELPGGLKVALLPKKTRGEKVVASMTLHFGNEKSLRGQTVAAGFVGPMLMRGTQKYTRQQIQDQLDKLGATLSVGSGAGSLSVSIQAKRTTLPAVLDLLQEVLRHPTFPEEEFGILHRASKQGLQKGLTDPIALARNALQRKLGPYPKDDVRYEPTIAEAIERLDQVTRGRVVKLYAEQVGAAVGELAVVGDFDEPALLKQVQGILAGWKSPVPYERIRYTAALDVPGGRETINTPDKENAVYVAAHMIAMKDTAPDYPALEMGNYVLGSGGFTSLLTDRVRVKEGLSYTVGSRLAVDPLDEYGKVAIFAICNPKVIRKVDATVADVVAKVLKEGVSATHLEEAKKGWLEEQKVARANDATLASELRGDLYLGRTMKYSADLEARVARLTVEEVNAALRRYVAPRRLVIVEAGDFRKVKDGGAK